MSLHTTRGRHKAPFTRRMAHAASLLLRGRYVPAPPPLHSYIADVRRSMDLPAGHMAQRAPKPAPLVATDRIQVIDADDECFGARGIVSEFTGPRSPIVVSLPIRQPSGGHRFGRRTYSAAQIAPVVEAALSADDTPTLVIDALDDVTLIGGAR